LGGGQSVHRGGSSELLIEIEKNTGETNSLLTRLVDHFTKQDTAKDIADQFKEAEGRHKKELHAVLAGKGNINLDGSPVGKTKSSLDVVNLIYYWF